MMVKLQQGLQYDYPLFVPFEDLSIYDAAVEYIENLLDIPRENWGQKEWRMVIQKYKELGGKMQTVEKDYVLKQIILPLVRKWVEEGIPVLASRLLEKAEQEFQKGSINKYILRYFKENAEKIEEYILVDLGFSKFLDLY